MGTVDRKGGEAERAASREPATVPSVPQPVALPPGPAELLGNRAMLHLLRSGRLQRKARLSKPDDPLEHEADRAAEAVLDVPSRDIPERLSRAPSTPQREPIAEASAGYKVSAGASGTPHPPPAPSTEAVAAALGGLGSGQPLDDGTRVFMEARFGESFSDVRVHTGDRAAEVNSSLAARAFTVGQDIVFGEHKYAPGTSEGQRLLAHELAHVVQQRGGSGSPEPGREAEGDADRAAHAAASDRAATVTSRAPPGTVQMDSEDVTWHSLPAGHGGSPGNGFWYLFVDGTMVGTVDGQNNADPVVEDVSAWEAEPGGTRVRVVVTVQGSASKTPYAQKRWKRVDIVIDQSVAPVPVPPTPVPPKVQPPKVQPPKKQPPKTQPPKAQPPKVQPPQTEPPEPEQPEQQVDEPKAPVPESSQPSVSQRVLQSLKSDPATAAGLAPQLTNSEMEKLDLESRVDLMKALASYRVGDQLDVSTVNRLLDNTPDRDVGSLFDRLQANNGQLRLALERGAKGADAQELGNGLMKLWTRSLFVSGGPGGRPDWLNNPFKLDQTPHFGPSDAMPVRWLGDAPEWAKGMSIKTDALGNWTVFTKDHPPLQLEGTLSRALRAERQELEAARRRARALPLGMRAERMKELAEKTWTGSDSEEEIIEMIEHPDDFEKKQLLESLDSATSGGKPLIDRLDEVIDGENNFRLHLALSKLRMSTLNDAKFAEGLSKAMVLPWHDTKVNAPANFFVTRLGDGRIQVKMSMLQVIDLKQSQDYGAEARKLPMDLYTGQGMVFDPDTPFVIHDYDAGQDVVLLARDLVGYQHKGVRKFEMDTVEVASYALPMAAGGSAAISTTGLLWDAAQIGLTITDEYRTEIRKSSPELLTMLDTAKMVIAARGVAGLAKASPAFIQNWRKAFETFKGRRALASFANESASSSKALAALEQETGALLAQVAKEEAAAGGIAGPPRPWSMEELSGQLPQGTHPVNDVFPPGPTHPWSVEDLSGQLPTGVHPANDVHLPSEPAVMLPTGTGGHVAQGPDLVLLPGGAKGAASGERAVNMAGPGGTGGTGGPVAVPGKPISGPVPSPGGATLSPPPAGRPTPLLGPGPGPTIVSLEQETVDALEQMWKTEIANNPARRADFERYIKNLRERRNLLSANGRTGLARSGEQSEKEMQFLTGSRHKQVHTSEGKTVPDFTQGTDWAGEVKNWNVLYPSAEEVAAAARGDLPPKLEALAAQVARRRLIYGNKQTVVIDIRGQLNLQGVDLATVARNRYLIHQVGRTVADAVGLPIEQIQIITW